MRREKRINLIFNTCVDCKKKKDGTTNDKYFSRTSRLVQVQRAEKKYLNQLIPQPGFVHVSLHVILGILYPVTTASISFLASLDSGMVSARQAT